MTEPAIVRLRGAVLLQGPALIDAARCVSATIEGLRRRDGIEPPERLRLLSAALRAEAEVVLSSARQDDVAVSDDHALLSSVDVLAWHTPREVAATMGVSVRTAQRWARNLGARRVGGRLLIDPVAVAELANERGSR